MKVPLLQSLDCVRLSVPDLDQALAFYRDRLGLSVVWRSIHPLGNGRFDGTAPTTNRCPCLRAYTSRG